MNTPKTIDEVASGTGVSITTVRLVLNGQAERYRISASTRQKVEDYVASHGVAINHAARSLKLKRSDTIGLVVPDLGNAFFSRLMAELEIHCRRHELMLLTTSSHEDPELEQQAIRKLLSRGVDGIIIAPCQPLQPRQFSGPGASALVCVDRRFGDDYPSVVSDHLNSARQLAAELIAEVGDDILFLCAQPELPSVKARIDGFIAACTANGMRDAARHVLSASHDTADTGAALMQQALQRNGKPPRAVMCSSMLVLEGVMQQLKLQLGSLPADLLLATFDRQPLLGFLPNRIISVIQNEAEIASRAFEGLLARLADPNAAVSHDIVDCQLLWH